MFEGWSNLLNSMESLDHIVTFGVHIRDRNSRCKPWFVICKKESLRIINSRGGSRHFQKGDGGGGERI